MPAEPAASSRGSSLAALPDRQPQIMRRHAQIARHRRGGTAPGQIREPPQCPLRRTAPADALEALVEGALRAGLVLAHESAHANGQDHDQCAHDVEHVPPPGPVRRHRGMRTRRAQGHGVAPGDMHHGEMPLALHGAESVHVSPTQT